MNTLESWLYHTPYEPQTRTKPMRVMALGFSRSGSESLSRALRILGYDHVFHGFEMFTRTPTLWRPWTLLGRRKWGTASTVTGSSDLERSDFDALFGNCEAITDQPGALFAPELIKAYPEAKVILNHRNVDDWYCSFGSVIRPLTSGTLWHVLPWFQADLYWQRRFVTEAQEQFFRGSWARHGKWVYEEHNAVIRGMVPREQLLEWTPGDGWEPICRFLEKDIPDEEFPSGNTPAHMLESYQNNVVRVIQTAWRNVGLTVVGIAGLLYAMGWQWGWECGLDVRAFMGYSISF
ncbi:hypothetical protein P170DRAFT_411610 [Aspergillus steynii IBT 23096]|uniref:NAD dependent epimerase/dehydratase n=1 Tax=Aspergillus steynii IBT 23096 TaxID=1392250 RepID=A0A2I2G0H2_9EURO|nr:uncharacterized protein P170DRAFT_411610 [Aspergillus steynii IBT 23096]PLB46380.1 hypothetical protein P170DRAFT_411610 [Aspergillus steynii IBT 23096]